jgi:uncharacterized protein (DUF983 family)
VVEQPHGAHSPYTASLKGRCPRCGTGKLFKGFLSVKPRCEACGLDYGFADSGDGPAVFIMFIVGFVVCGLALWAEFTYTPPMWLHMALWLPLTAILCLALARPMKSMMIAAQYHNRAEQGRVER